MSSKSTARSAPGCRIAALPTRPAITSKWPACTPASGRTNSPCSIFARRSKKASKKRKSCSSRRNLRRLRETAGIQGSDDAGAACPLGSLACTAASCSFRRASPDRSCQKKVAGSPAALRGASLRKSLRRSLARLGRPRRSESLPVSLAGAMDGPVLESAALSRLCRRRSGVRPVPRPASPANGPRLCSRARLAYHRLRRTRRGRNPHHRNGRGSFHRQIAAIVVRAGSSPMAALNQLAHGFSPSARAVPTSNADALRAYAPRSNPTPAQRETFSNRRFTLDPASVPRGSRWSAPTWPRGDRAAADGRDRAGRSSQKLDPFSTGRARSLKRPT